VRNIKLTIEYDGTNYHGWQVQPNGETVQNLIQKAVSKMTGEKAAVNGASRTDAGVHAVSQVACFKTGSKISCDGFRKGLNSLLPDDIAIYKVEDVPLRFHPKRDSKYKHYRYLILNSETRSALMKNRTWFIPKREQKLDMRRMRGAASVLVGVHDFSAFCSSADCNKSKVREIYDIKVVKSSPIPPFLKGGEGGLEDLFIIDIFGNGFLKNMVRNVVGTLVKVSGSEMKSILKSRDRKKAGVCAPASGLYLMEVVY
jgi:tRNA pseudouridine38-40 synthase